MDDWSDHYTTNKLLVRMLPQDRSLFSQLLRPRAIAARQYLERRGTRSQTIYFIESGVVSNLETADLRDPVEVGVIGHEGMVGTSAIADLVPQRDSYVQIAGRALALDCAEFQKALSSSVSLRFFMYRYVQVQLVQISLAVSAGVRASVQQRLARKLLMYHDRTQNDDLPLTHESMSLMLGTRRATVTNAIHNLEAENLIRARRGLVTIRDRAGLEEYCGPFYGIAEARYAQIMDDIPQTAHPSS